MPKGIRTVQTTGAPNNFGKTPRKLSLAERTIPKRRETPKVIKYIDRRDLKTAFTAPGKTRQNVSLPKTSKDPIANKAKLISNKSKKAA